MLNFSESQLPSPYKEGLNFGWSLVPTILTLHFVRSQYNFGTCLLGMMVLWEMHCISPEKMPIKQMDNSSKVITNLRASIQLSNQILRKPERPNGYIILVEKENTVKKSNYLLTHCEKLFHSAIPISLYRFWLLRIKTKCMGWFFYIFNW